MRAASSVPAESPYRLGNKVLISRVAGLLHTEVKELAPALLAWHASGALVLARVDLVQAFDKTPGALRRSLIRAAGMPESSGFHAIDVGAF